MARLLDTDWLCAQTDCGRTRAYITQAAQWQQTAVRENVLPVDHRPIPLRLGEFAIWTELSSAFCTLELYEEIFRDQAHFHHPDFVPRPGWTVLDIGANHGLYALAVIRRCRHCRVVCVEPNPYVFAMLQRTVSANGLTQVRLERAAVGGVDGRAALAVVRQIHAIGGRSVRETPRAWMREDFIETVTVPVVSVPTLRRRQALEHIDLCKVDAEGAEVEIIEHAPWRGIDRLVVERHSRAIRDRLLDICRGRGFCLQREEDADVRRYHGDMYWRCGDTAGGAGQGRG